MKKAKSIYDLDKQRDRQKAENIAEVLWWSIRDESLEETTVTWKKFCRLLNLSQPRTRFAIHYWNWARADWVHFIEKIMQEDYPCSLAIVHSFGFRILTGIASKHEAVKRGLEKQVSVSSISYKNMEKLSKVHPEFAAALKQSGRMFLNPLYSISGIIAQSNEYDDLFKKELQKIIGKGLPAHED